MSGSTDSSGSRRLLGADGNVLAIDVFGSVGAPSAILLHGGGQSRSSWRVAAHRLGDAGYQACTLDLRGHGDSDWSPEGDYHIERFVADLVTVIDALGAPAVLIGASFGGHVALITAAQHPSQVRALALCDVTPWIEGDATNAMRAIMRAAAAGFATVKEAAANIDAIRGFSSGRDPEDLLAYMRRGSDDRLYWRWDPRFIDDRYLQDGDENGILVVAASSLAVPTLLLRAEYSTVVSRDQVAKFRTVVPQLITTEILGAGHMVAGDVNDAYASAILAFLASLPKKSALPPSIVDYHD